MSKIADKLREIKELKEKKKSYEEKIKEINEEVTELEEDAIVMMEDAGVDSLRVALDDGRRFTFYPMVRPFARLVDEPEFSQWCEDNGIERQSVNAISAQKLTSLYKERLEDPDASLPSGVEVFEKTTIGSRAVGK